MKTLLGAIVAVTFVAGMSLLAFAADEKKAELAAGADESVQRAGVQ